MRSFPSLSECVVISSFMSKFVAGDGVSYSQIDDWPICFMVLFTLTWTCPDSELHCYLYLASILWVLKWLIHIKEWTFLRQSEIVNNVIESPTLFAQSNSTSHHRHHHHHRHHRHHSHRHCHHHNQNHHSIQHHLSHSNQMGMKG